MGLLPTPAALLIRIAAALFLFTAYSAWDARGQAKAQGFQIPTTLGSPLPVDLVVQALVAFGLMAVGVIWSAAPLKEISWASEMGKRSIDSEDSRIPFANVRHRGAMLFRPT